MVEERRLLWEKKSKEFPQDFNRPNEIATEVHVVKVDDLIRFEVLQTTSPILAKRVKNDYVLFRLTIEEVEAILAEAKKEAVE